MLLASTSLCQCGKIESELRWKSISPLICLSGGSLLTAALRNFSRMKVGNSMERSNFFVQTTSTLFHPDPFPTSTTGILTVESIIVRHERQTFRRLPNSNAILLTVRTYMDRLTTLNEKQRRDFARTVRDWPDNLARYKGRDFWGRVALQYCDEMAGVGQA